MGVKFIPFYKLKNLSSRKSIWIHLKNVRCTPQLPGPKQPKPLYLTLILTLLSLNYQNLRKNFFSKLNPVLCSANIFPGPSGTIQCHRAWTAVKQPITLWCGQHPSFLRSPKDGWQPTNHQEAVSRTHCPHFSELPKQNYYI